MCKHDVKVSCEGSSHCVLDCVQHPEAVFIVNQTIAKYSEHFVRPESDADISAGDLVACGHADAADNLAEVTQVEGVVTFHGCRF